MKMKLENRSKKISVALLALAVISLSLIAPAMSFRFGQSTGGADYAIFEGVAANDYYDSRQYSYKINQWAYDQELYEIINPDDVYFDASKSLRVGFTEYGEFATPQNAGIAYGADADEWNRTESWASSAIDPKYWIQGWTLYVNYSRAGTWRGLLAYAIYSDMNTVEAGRKVYTWYSTYDLTDPLAEITAGSLTTSGIQVLYDSARLAVGRTSVVIHDGKYNEDFAKVTFTVVFNKDTKYAIVYKDVKILLDPKVLDSIVDFAFSERYELDLARNINPGNEAYIHYYHNYSNTVYQHPLTGESTYDALQAFDKGMNYIYFAGYWPNATEYSVYSRLVPDMVPPVVDTTVLPPGFAQPDIPSPPGEPSTPWVLVQWRYNYDNWPKMLYWLAKSDPYREIRFVEVVGMTDFNADPYPAMDVNASAPYNTTDQLDTEVAYLLDQVFNPEDLTTINDDPFMWIGLGQSAATTDSAGAGLLPDMPQNYLEEPFMLFDRNDTAFPWLAPVIGMKGTIPYGLNEWGGNYYEQFSNSGKGTGTDTTLYKRTTLKGFAFGVYDDVIKSPPQPIAGGWSNYSSTGGYWYWYPSKDPLTERWKYTGTTWTMPGYDDVTYHPNGILSLGGMKANGLTRYFNDFYYAISREGTGAYALINGGTVTGSAPTSDFALATFDYYPISTWASSKSTFGYKEGYAVIALARDINGTRGLAIYGWDGRDTFWAAAWASQYLGQFNSWIPAGTVALVLKITYTTADREPSGFTVVKALGTITELGSNAFAVSPGFDK
ncbi:MAG: hypothetical protein ACPL4I_12440, partial [Bacteroidota bacterium]